MALECIRDLFGLQSAPLSSQLVRVFPAAGSLSITTLPRWSPLHECVCIQSCGESGLLWLFGLSRPAVSWEVFLLLSAAIVSQARPTSSYTTTARRRLYVDQEMMLFSTFSTAAAAFLPPWKSRPCAASAGKKKAIHQVDLPSIKLGSNLPCSHIGRPSTWLILCCRRMWFRGWARSTFPSILTFRDRRWTIPSAIARLCRENRDLQLLHRRPIGL